MMPPLSDNKVGVMTTLGFQCLADAVLLILLKNDVATSFSCNNYAIIKFHVCSAVVSSVENG